MLGFAFGCGLVRRRHLLGVCPAYVFGGSTAASAIGGISLLLPAEACSQPLRVCLPRLRRAWGGCAPFRFSLDAHRMAAQLGSPRDSLAVLRLCADAALTSSPAMRRFVGVMAGCRRHGAAGGLLAGGSCPGAALKKHWRAAFCRLGIGGAGCASSRDTAGRAGHGGACCRATAAGSEMAARKPADPADLSAN